MNPPLTPAKSIATKHASRPSDKFRTRALRSGLFFPRARLRASRQHPTPENGTIQAPGGHRLPCRRPAQGGAAEMTANYVGIRYSVLVRYWHLCDLVDGC